MVTDTNPTIVKINTTEGKSTTQSLHMQLVDNLMSYLCLAVMLIQDKQRAPTAIQSRYHLIAKILEKGINWFRK